MNKEYEDAWAEGGTADTSMADPATSAVRAAAQAERDGDAKEFSDAFHASANNESSGDMLTDAKAPADSKKTIEDDSMVTPAAPAKEKSFNEALAEAKGTGHKLFDWNGKKYTTEAKAKPSTPVATPGAASA